MLNGTNEKRTIVVVEDNMIVSMELRDRLQRHGYEVAGFASKGDEAVEVCLAKMPDLVLMYVILDGKMTGIEAVEEIHKKADIPVIYLTAFSDRDTVVMAKNTTPYGYLIKPIDEKELFVTIEMAFARLDFQRKIEESELKFRNLFEDSRDAIYIYETGGKSDFNASMLELFGYSEEEMKKMGIGDFFADRNEMKNYLETMKREGYVKNLPVCLKKKNGA
jgi:AmiR/NasT family two-component response regulator